LLYDDLRRGSPLTNDLAETFSFMLKEGPCLSCKVPCRHSRSAKGTCLRILHDTLGMKHSIFVGFPMPWTRIGRPKESLCHMELFRYYRALFLLVSRVSSLEMNYASFCVMPVIRYGPHHEMKCQKESVSQKIDTENCLI
jgi:hypothetical protein